MKTSRYLAAVVLMAAFFTNLNAQSAEEIAAGLKGKNSSKTSSLLKSTDSNSLADALSRSPQLALASKDYMVTAGDVYTLGFLAGSSTVSYVVTVDISYKIKIANLGTLDVKGKKYTQVKKEVEEIVSKNYPLSGVQFVLTSPGQFKVVVRGEVKETKEVTAWALTRLSEVLAENLTDFSSKRDIIVAHSNGTEDHYDLYEAERNGRLLQNPYMREGDIVVVKRRGRVVTLKGAIERPGEYELRESDNLKKAIEYYGSNYTDYANKERIQLTRFDGNQDSNVLYLTDKNVQEDMDLMDHDVISISTVDELLPVMFMEGALLNTNETDEVSVTTKLPVQFTPNTNYTYFIRSNKSLFNAVADLENAYIARGMEIIPVNINRILYEKDYFVNETVQSYDKLIIPFKQFFVSVSGAVMRPGRYPYIPDRDYLYYVNLAGGFNEDRNSGGKIKIIDLEGKKHGKSEPVLPEYTIQAESNSFTYYFSKYAPIITTCLSIVSTSIAVYAATN
ncbi:MAG: SLBB domain-containing protein [Treponema sp.]|nr:SLBB domain-containing protein [Candidatus Treponema equi]